MTETIVPGEPPSLQVDGLSKSFAGVPVLRDVSLSVSPGTVRGLVGGNGAGKSTLIKILSGFHQPEPGARVAVDGREVPLPLKPGEAAGYGLSFVQQDLALVPRATVLENLRVGLLRPHAFGRVSWKDERVAAREALDRVGLALDLDAELGTIGVTQRAMLAVARAVAQTLRHPGAGVLVLDEPTAYLPHDGVDLLFDAVRRVVDLGTAALFVSHRLDEVLSLTDTVTVLRDGRVVADLVTRQTTEQELIDEILGQDLGEVYPDRAPAGSEPAFRVEGLRGRVADGVTFGAARGEILGLTGITGMGHDEIPYLLVGEHRGTGTLDLGGRAIDLAQQTPRRAVRDGIALVPADRPGLSGVLEFSVKENVSLPVLPGLLRGLRPSRNERRAVDGLLTAFGVRPAHAGEKRLGQLSGGNQQKALLAKWIQTKPAVLVLHEPTQGVDVMARRDVFAMLQELASSGVTILISSAEHEDLAHICHRVLVMRRGRIVAELGEGALTARAVMEACLRSDPARAATVERETT